MLSIRLACKCWIPIWQGDEYTLPNGIELAERVVAAQTSHTCTNERN